MAKRQTNRTKKSKIPPALVVGGIFFLLIALIFLLVVELKVDNLKKEYNSKKPEKQVVNKKRLDINVDEKLKTFLFDHEISKERLKFEAEQNSNDLIFHKYRMLLSEAEFKTIKPALESFFKTNGFKIQDNGNNLIFEKENVVVEIVVDILDLHTAENYHEKKEKEINHDSSKKETQEKNIPSKIDAKHKFAIILDDSGQNLELAKKVLSMKYPIVLSILPYTKYDRETADLARKHNREFFLHQPMEPKSYPDTKPGQGAILLSMPKSVIEATIKENIKRLGGVDGVNNHMGSAFTENAEKMKETLDIIKDNAKIFVDSHTTPNTVAYDLCRKTEGLKCGISKRFIDNSADPVYITNKLYEAAKFLNSQDVIVIGHLRNNTVDVLEKVLPELEKKGVEIVPVSEVVR